MQMGQSTGANLGVQQAQANQMNAQIANQQTTSNMFGTGIQAFASNADKLGGKDNSIFTPGK